MKEWWSRLGLILFWLGWPMLYVYMRLGMRTRVLIIFEGNILVVKGWLSSGKWSLPGGGLHRNEEPLLGAIREVREEIGIALDRKSVMPLGVAKVRQSGLICRYHQFVINMDEQPLIKLQRIEIISSTWLPLDTLPLTEVGDDVMSVVVAWKKSPKPATI